MNCFGNLFDELQLFFADVEEQMSRLDYWEGELECQEDTTMTERESATSPITLTACNPNCAESVAKAG